MKNIEKSSKITKINEKHTKISKKSQKKTFIFEKKREQIEKCAKCEEFWENYRAELKEFQKNLKIGGFPASSPPVPRQKITKI